MIFNEIDYSVGDIFLHQKFEKPGTIEYTKEKHNDIFKHKIKMKHNAINLSKEESQFFDCLINRKFSFGDRNQTYYIFTHELEDDEENYSFITELDSLIFKTFKIDTTKQMIEIRNMFISQFKKHKNFILEYENIVLIFMVGSQRKTKIDYSKYIYNRYNFKELFQNWTE